MRSLSAAELLYIWERGRTQSPPQRALALLASAFTDAAPGELAQLSIGQRDARLLALREGLFGPHLESVAVCPHCGERLELSIDVADIRVEALPAGGTIPGEDGIAPLSFHSDGYTVRFRLPNSLDLAAVAGIDDLGEARHALFGRCLIAVEHQGSDLPVEALPEDIGQAVEKRMAEADLQGDVWLALSCPECAHEWSAPFDALAYLWSEIEAWAGRTLRQVGSLASAFGWSEADILGMSAWRRQLYLEMVNGR